MGNEISDTVLGKLVVVRQISGRMNDAFPQLFNDIVKKGDKFYLGY